MSCAVTAQLISVFVFDTRIVQSIYFLNPKFRASSHFQWLYSPLCVWPGQKPRRPVFSQRGSYIRTMQHLLLPFNDLSVMCIVLTMIGINYITTIMHVKRLEIISMYSLHTDHMPSSFYIITDKRFSCWVLIFLK